MPAFIIVALFLFSLVPISSAGSDVLMEKQAFKESEQSTVLVHPVFNDQSTNIAFYGKLEGDVTQFIAENLGHGDLPFSDYWAPPSAGAYTAVEYRNDAQQFSCSNLTLSACLNDPHFINQFSFQMLADDSVILPEATDTATSSITSALEEGETVTAPIDVPVSTSTPEEVPVEATGTPTVTSEF